MKNPNTLLLFIFALGIFACEDAKPKILQEEHADTDIGAQSITIQLQENGGMLPYSTDVLISNEEESYVAFFVDGIKNKVSINPSREEVQAIVKTMQERNFAKIKTREVEALDRGGSSVSLSLNGKTISISNMGFSFVKDKYVSDYAKIVEDIYSLAKKHTALVLPKVEVELDASLLKKEWRTSWRMNRDLFVEQSVLSTNDGFQKAFYTQVLPENSIDVQILSETPETLGENIFNWQHRLVMPKDVQKIKFKLVDGDIVIIYNGQENNDERKEATNLEILENQKLNELSAASMLQIDLSKEQPDGDYEPFQLNISYKNKTADEAIPLVKTYGSFVDTYADIHYQLMSTGQAEAPYLLYYSGQAGDEYNTPGILVLFSETQKIAELVLNDGNRINSKIIDLGPDWIKVREAILCHQSIETTIAFSPEGLQRLKGFFPTNTVYPTDNYADNDRYELKEDIEVSIDQSSKTYQAGESIKMTLQRIDFDLGTVFLKIDNKEVSLSLEKFKSLEIVQSMAGAKCEMG